MPDPPPPSRPLPLPPKEDRKPATPPIAHHSQVNLVAVAFQVQWRQLASARMATDGNRIEFDWILLWRDFGTAAAPRRPPRPPPAAAAAAAAAQLAALQTGRP